MTMIKIAACPLCERPPGVRMGPPEMVRCLNKACEGSKERAYTTAEWNALPERSGPWIEYGTGWAKVHNLGEITADVRARLEGALKQKG